MKILTSRGEYELAPEAASRLLGSAIDGLADRLVAFLDTAEDRPELVSKDEVNDAEILREVGGDDYRDVWEPIIVAWEAK